MTQLRALGGLELSPGAFTQPKPLLLLAYLALEGAQQRRHLAELFWPEGQRMKSLSMTLTRLKQGAKGVVTADDKRAWTDAACDARALLGALERSEWGQADQLYRGAFAEGVVLEDWSSELEDWVYGTREYLASRVQHGLLNLAEDAARRRDFGHAAGLAERAYRLPGLGGSEPTSLKRLYRLLCAGQSLLAPEVRRDAESYGLSVMLSTERAQAEAAQPRGPMLPLRGTSFVGRDLELSEIAHLLAKSECRLLTLTGPGGVGKTRLALRLAQEQASRYPDGLHFVPLDALADPALLAATLSSHLGLSVQQDEPLEALRRFFGAGRSLLILDNLEHLMAGVGAISHLLETCPSLTLLATSREPLRLGAEQVYAVSGLAHDGDALQLFAERARQFEARFSLEAERADVERICRLVDGIPLAVELAAAWVRLMPCRDVAEELQRDLDFLESCERDATPRHRSLRGVFEASWRLLSAGEQDALARLSVFRGGFRRDAASLVAGATMPVLAALVDKSLLRVLPSGRYDRHALLYQFTGERLAAKPQDEAAARDRHAAFYLELAEEAARHLYTDARGAWFRRFDEELDNLRAVLERAVADGDAETGLQLLCALPEFWQTRGYQREADAYLEACLTLSADKASPLYVRGLQTLAASVWQQGDVSRSRSRLEEARALAEKTGDRAALAKTLGLLGRVHHYNLGDSATARALYERAAALAQAVDNRAYQASALNLLAILVSEQGDFALAQAHYTESLALWRAVGNRSGVAYVLNNLANISDNRGDYRRAGQLFAESLALFRELGEKDGVAMALGNLGVNAAQQGRYDEARPHLAESLALAREVGDERLTAYLLRALGSVARHQGDDEEAEERFRQSYDLYAHFGYAPGMGDALRELAELFAARGTPLAAEAAYREGLSISRGAHDLWNVTHFLRGLALFYLDQGRLDAVPDLLAESLDLALEMGNRKDAMLALEGFAMLAAADGRPQDAAFILGATEPVREQLRLARDEREAARVARLLPPDAALEPARERGRHTPLEEATAFARGAVSR